MFIVTGSNTAAINVQVALAAAAGGGEVYIPAGVYTVTVPIIGADNVTLQGDRGGTIIQIPGPTPFYDYVVHGIGFDNFHVQDIRFDMGNIDPPDDNWPIAASGAVVLGSNGTKGGANCSILRCEIVNMGLYGFVTRGGTRNLEIAHCELTRSAPLGTGNIGIMLRKDGGVANFFPKINHNRTTNTCGFGGAMYHGQLGFNIMRNSGFGANMAVDQDPLSSGNTIIGNNCSNMQVLPPVNGGNGIENWSVDAHIIGNKVEANLGGWGIAQAGPGGSIDSNMIYDNSNGVLLMNVAGANSNNTYLNGNKSRGNGGPTPLIIHPGVTGTVQGSNDWR